MRLGNSGDVRDGEDMAGSAGSGCAAVAAAVPQWPPASASTRVDDATTSDNWGEAS